MALGIAKDEFFRERCPIIDEYRKIILRMRALESEISGRLKANDPDWRNIEKKRNELYRQLEPLINRYWEIIPVIELSRCPFCDQVLKRRFDPFDLNGFWWMDRTQRPSKEPEHCAHFCVLTGAVNFNGRPVSGGLFECLPGPDVAYVIPRILELPTMIAVVSEIPMSCGYTAYAIAYFAQEPPTPKALTQSWASKVFQFRDKGGKSGWDIKDESYDFELAPWIKSGKLLWYVDNILSRPGEDIKLCPLLDKKGEQKPQVVINDQLRFR